MYTIECQGHPVLRSLSGSRRRSPGRRRGLRECSDVSSTIDSKPRVDFRPDPLLDDDTSVPPTILRQKHPKTGLPVSGNDCQPVSDESQGQGPRERYTVQRSSLCHSLLETSVFTTGKLQLGKIVNLPSMCSSRCVLTLVVLRSRNLRQDLR